MNDSDRVNDLVDMLDRLMSQGSGHVNILGGDEGNLSVTTVNSTDCCKNGACSVPTLHKGIDDND